MPGYLGLALLEDLDEVADADLAAVHEIEQAEAGVVGQRREETNQVEGCRGVAHIAKYTP